MSGVWWWQRSSVAAVPPPPPPPAQPAAGFLRLPPLQRSIAPLAPSLRPSGPDSWIGSWRSPGFLGEMGHALHSSAPEGLVGGLASAGRPVPWGNTSQLPLSPEEDEATPEPQPTLLQRLFSPRRAALTTRRARRAAGYATPAASPTQPAAGTSRRGAPAPWPAPSADGGPVSTGAVSTGAVSTGVAASLPPSAAARTAPVVQRATRRRLGTAIPVPPRPLPVIPAAAAGAAAGPSPYVAAPDAPSVNAPLIASGPVAPPAQQSMHDGGRTSTRPEQSAPHPPVSVVRRTGLGAPLVSDSAPRPVQRNTTSSPLRPAAPVKPRTGLGPPLTPGMPTSSAVDSITDSPAPGVSGPTPTTPHAAGAATPHEAEPLPLQQARPEPSKATLPSRSGARTAETQVPPVQRALIGPRALVPRLQAHVPVERARTAPGVARAPRQRHRGAGKETRSEMPGAAIPSQGAVSAAALRGAVPSRAGTPSAHKGHSVTGTPATTTSPTSPVLQRASDDRQPRQRGPRWRRWPWSSQRSGNGSGAHEVAVTGLPLPPAAASGETAVSEARHTAPQITVRSGHVDTPASEAHPVQRTTAVNKPRSQGLAWSWRAVGEPAGSGAVAATGSAAPGPDRPLSAVDRAGSLAPYQQRARPPVPERVVRVSTSPARRGLPVLQRVHSSPVMTTTLAAPGATAEGQRQRAMTALTGNRPSGTAGRPGPAPGRQQTVQPGTSLPLHPTGIPMAPAPAQTGDVALQRATASPPARSSRNTPAAAQPPIPLSRDNGVTGDGGATGGRQVQREVTPGASQMPVAPPMPPMPPAPGGAQMPVAPPMPPMPVVPPAPHASQSSPPVAPPIPPGRSSQAPPAPTAPPTPTAPPVPPPPPPRGSRQQAPGQRDLDELARRLYGPISRRLRAELRLDRERAGRVMDR